MMRAMPFSSISDRCRRVVRGACRAVLLGTWVLAGLVYAAEPPSRRGALAVPAVSASAQSLPAPPQSANEDTPGPVRPATPGPDPAGAARRAANDRLDLDTTVVTGNRELPKVMVIVPWKKADLGELPGEPINSLLDEVLTPVDRDVFRREVTYYDAVSGAAGPSRAPLGSTSGTQRRQ